MFARALSITRLGPATFGNGLRFLTQLVGRPGLKGEETDTFPKYLNGFRRDFPYRIDGTGVEKGNLEAYSRHIRPVLDQLLLDHGAVIFKGLPLESSHDFSRFYLSLGYDARDYLGGMASRLKVAEGVIEASTYEEPCDTMEPHCELCYFDSFPHIFFLYTEVAPSPGCGGECGVTDQMEVYKKLDPSVVEKIKTKGVRYHRCLMDRDNPNPLLGYGCWQMSFRTDSRKEAERLLGEAGHTPDQISWGEDGSLRFWSNTPAMAPHYRTGELVWFNQIDAAHVTYFQSKTAGLYEQLKDKPPESAPYTTFYGDGTEIEPEVIRHIRSTQWSCTLAEQTEKGDVIVLDNMRVAHSKFGFSGKRLMRLGLARYKEVKPAAV